VSCGQDIGVATTVTAVGSTVAPTTTTLAATTTTGPSTSAATTTSTEAPEPLDLSQLEGSWLIGGPNGIVITFHADGTHGVSYRNLVPFEEGTVEIDGDVVILIVTEGSDLVCPIGAPGRYRFRLSDDGQTIAVTFVSDTCGERTELVNGLTRYVP
jgi:hypothetical protein